MNKRAEKMTFDFSGKTVLITGATSGIGAAIANIFRNLHANLLLTGHIKQEIDSFNQDLDAASTENERYYHVEFSDHESLDTFLSFIQEQERIDVLINNAGINRNNSLTEVECTDLDMLLAVNLRAPFLIMQAAGRVMKRNSYGRIVNISSIWGVITRDRRSVYSTTKAGLIGLTRTAAVDLATFNVLVNAVSPGFVMTDLTRRTVPAKEAEQLADLVPMKRFAEPEEIAKTVVFLASDHNTYITGQNIIIDGGFVCV